jgi:hypothetical protein
MQWLRTIPYFVRLLVASFLLAQLAGVISSPRANAQATADAVWQDHHDHMAHHHGSDSDQGGGHRHEHGGINADTCCALHAYFVGLLPQVFAVGTVTLVSARLAADLDDHEMGVPPGRLDRPPRPLR